MHHPGTLRDGAPSTATRPWIDTVVRPVWCVVPCFGRRADLEALLRDLARQETCVIDAGLRRCVELTVIVVDNASPEPLSDVAMPSGLRVEHVRLPSNTGGSGGFSAGIEHALARAGASDDGFIWLVDSDARVSESALVELTRALDARSDMAAVGSVLADTATGRVFEAGGWIHRRTGEYVQPLAPGWNRRRVIECDYLAACSLLVRVWAARSTGTMADMFLNGDDVEWCVRLRRRTGGKVGAVPSSVVYHPHPDKMRTWTRYYAARNAFTVIDAAGLGRRTRLARGILETGRALSMAMTGRDDLADMHLRGLSDAVRRRTGRGADVTSQCDAWTPMPELVEAVADACLENHRGATLLRPGLGPEVRRLARTLSASGARVEVRANSRGGILRTIGRVVRRMIAGPRYRCAVVSARSRVDDWMVARTIITVSPDGFAERHLSRANRIWTSVRIIARGAWLSVRLAARRSVPPRDQAPELAPSLSDTQPPSMDAGITRPSVSVVVLSYNRWPKLERTLTHLRSDPALRDAPIIVVDNASTDGTPAKLADHFPDVTVVALTENRGVEAFNEGVRRRQSEVVLILDDDAWPAPGVAGKALDLMARRPDLGAAPLLPTHPTTGKEEWRLHHTTGFQEEWPVMGCGNFVRRSAWLEVGGYEDGFFLYRNDVDLALKLLESGWGVCFDPSWRVWHDSPAAARKSPRWHRLATRNWIWMSRRHGRGWRAALGALLGWAWAHRLAGFNPTSHAQTVLGGIEGVFGQAPRWPRGRRGAGDHYAKFLSLQLGARSKPARREA